eukprot:m.173297 g.173297  ORF g.173297 m.173297 type:complete len:584 (-) comp13675_c0_seq1:169-1920(-)
MSAADDAAFERALEEGELSTCQHKCGVFAVYFSRNASTRRTSSTRDDAKTPTEPKTSGGDGGCASLPDSATNGSDASATSTPKEFPVAGMIAMGLQQLQHRGQECCGIVTSDGAGKFSSLKGMGLVASVCKETELKTMGGNMGIGHVRYSTAGGKSTTECQPLQAYTTYGQIALAHNGELVNAEELMPLILRHGVGMTTKSDSEVIMQMLCSPAPPPSAEHLHGANWQARIRAFMSRSATSYSVAFLTEDSMYAFRDPFGNRPLCVGSVPSPEGNCWIISSESCAFSAIEATFIREVRPGEIIKVDDAGVHSLEIVPRVETGSAATRTLSTSQLPPFRSPKKISTSAASSDGSLTPPPPKPAAFCIFEYVYFARQDSMLGGRMVHSIRRRCGKTLFEESPVECDIVSTVPESAIPAAVGYAEAAGIPFDQVLNKNRYVGRSFIEPTTFLRQSAVARKFSPLVENIAGKRVVLIDDSIVRGNTMGPIVKLLRKAGATEVHVRIASPPLKHACYMGINIPDAEELVANNMTLAEMTKHFGVDSLAYLSHDGLVKSVSDELKPEHGEDTGLCSACLTGEYPVALHW